MLPQWTRGTLLYASENVLKFLLFMELCTPWDPYRATLEVGKTVATLRYEDYGAKGYVRYRMLDFHGIPVVTNVVADAHEWYRDSETDRWVKSPDEDYLCELLSDSIWSKVEHVWYDPSVGNFYLDLGKVV